MRRLVEAEIAPVINRGQALVGVLGIMDAVIATPAGHQRRDHHLRADAERLAHEIFGELSSLFDDDATELVAEGERPRQRLRPVAFEDMKVGAAHPAGADLDQRGVLRDLRPRHRADDRLGAGTGEGGDSDGAVAHGIARSVQILSRIIACWHRARIRARSSRSSIVTDAHPLARAPPRHARDYVRAVLAKGEGEPWRAISISISSTAVSTPISRSIASVRWLPRLASRCAGSRSTCAKS